MVIPNSDYDRIMARSYQLQDRISKVVGEIRTKFPNTKILRWSDSVTIEGTDAVACRDYFNKLMEKM